MQCILELCGLYDAEKSQFKIDNNWRIFAPCQIIPFTLKLREDNKETVKRKNCFFLSVGAKDSNTDYCLKKPGNQYSIKDKVHALTTPPSSIAMKATDKMHKPRLNKKEKELIKELKEIASLRLLQLSRQKQFPRNASKTKEVPSVTRRQKNILEQEERTKALSQAGNALRSFVTMSGGINIERCKWVVALLDMVGSKLSYAMNVEAVFPVLGETPASPDVTTSTTATATPGDAKATAKTRTNGSTHNESPAIPDTSIATAATPNSIATVTPVTPSPNDDDKATVVLFDDSIKNDDLKLARLLREIVSYLSKERKENCYEIEHWNGTKQAIAFPSRTQSIAAFMSHANETKWIEKMYPNKVSRDGILTYLAEKHTADFENIAKVKRNLQCLPCMSTISTEALSILTKFTGQQLKDTRSFIYHETGLRIKHKADESDELGKGPQPVFGEYTYHEGGKYVEKIRYWTTDTCEEAAHAIQQHYCEMVDEHESIESAAPLTLLPSLDYDLPNGKRGCTAMAGGDHGDIAFRFHWQFQLTSPQHRKQKNDLSLGCKLAQVGYVECKKDKFEILENTIMAKLEESRQLLIDSCAVAVYTAGKLTENRVIFLPKEIDNARSTIVVSGDGIGRELRFCCKQGTCRQEQNCEEQPHTKALDTCFNSEKVSDLHWSLAVSHFNDLYVADLELLANLIGMLNCGSNNCCWCEQRQGKFGEGLGTKRTRASLDAHFRTYQAREQAGIEKGNKTKPKAVYGVTKYPLLGIDPAKVLIPSLHCEIGLINRSNEAQVDWVQLEVESLPPACHAIRLAFKTALKEEKQRETELVLNNQPELLEEQKEARRQAKKTREAAERAYKTMVADFGKREHGFVDRQEYVFNKVNMKHEAYFAGKLNGNSVRRQMECAKEYSDLILEEVLTVWDEEQSDRTELEIRQHCHNHRQLLGSCDALFAHIRGVDTGLVPTEEQIQELENIVERTKQWWHICGLPTLQPKWHIVFFHLVEQVRMHHGIADKNDDMIEKAHQPWKREKERTWNVKNFRQQKNCQLKAIRKRSHFKIQSTLKRFACKRRRTFKSDQNPTTKKEVKAGLMREAKVEKRQDFV
jgi:hypothetical protein